MKEGHTVGKTEIDTHNDGDREKEKQKKTKNRGTKGNQTDIQ